MRPPQNNFNLARYSSGIFVPVGVLAIGLLAYFLLLPEYKDLAVHRKDLDAKIASVEARKLDLQNIQGLIKELKDKKEKLAPIDESLPTAPQIPELLANMDELTKRSGVLITSMQVVPAPTAATVVSGLEVTRIKRTQEILSQTEGMTVIQIDMGLKGKYPNMLALLKNLEQNLRLLDVQAITLDQVDEESGTQDFALQIQTYFQKDAN